MTGPSAETLQALKDYVDWFKSLPIWTALSSEERIAILTAISITFLQSTNMGSNIP